MAITEADSNMDGADPEGAAGQSEGLYSKWPDRWPERRAGDSDVFVKKNLLMDLMTRSS